MVKSKKKPQEEPSGHLKWFLIGGVGVALIAGLVQTVYMMMVGWQTRIISIGMEDPDQLKQVILGGDPYVIYCSRPNAGVPSVIESASYGLKNLCRFAIMNCSEPFPSGKTIFQRFNIPDVPNDLNVLLCVNGDKPKRIPTDQLASPLIMTNYVKELIEPKVSGIQEMKDFQSLCLNRKHCLVIGTRKRLTSEELKTLQSALVPHRDVRFVTVDIEKFELLINGESDNSVFASVLASADPTLFEKPVLFVRNVTETVERKGKKRILSNMSYRKPLNALALEEIGPFVGNSKQLEVEGEFIGIQTIKLAPAKNKRKKPTQKPSPTKKPKATPAPKRTSDRDFEAAERHVEEQKRRDRERIRKMEAELEAEGTAQQFDIEGEESEIIDLD
eukprot:GILJ01008455.1.p1 GENE.GILJ01008455.1~~GILJ01008455.1.p1  ORF type:complete len:388 (-),score=46.28 GILJ01008455.1:190-1353(-)